MEEEHCRELAQRARNTEEQYEEDSFLNDGELEYEDDDSERLPDEDEDSSNHNQSQSSDDDDYEHAAI